MQTKTLAHLCKEAYTHATYNINECEVIIRRFDDVQVVAFRGTETGALFAGAGWVDVLRDLHIFPWYDKDCGLVHAGFLKGAQSTAEFIAGRLVNDLPVICTGHSLGGALALLTAAKLQAKGFVIEKWVGFGSPMTQLTKRKYTFEQWNYRYCADIVPTMPRYVFHRIFEFIATLSLPPLLTKLLLMLPKKQWYRHNYPVIVLRPDPGRETTWDDHGIDLYIDALV